MVQELPAFENFSLPFLFLEFIVIVPFNIESLFDIISLLVISIRQVEAMISRSFFIPFFSKSIQHRIPV
jgi:hypothetical protein